jgi:hypothetical protein
MQPKIPRFRQIRLTPVRSELAVAAALDGALRPSVSSRERLCVHDMAGNVRECARRFRPPPRRRGRRCIRTPGSRPARALEPSLVTGELGRPIGYIGKFTALGFAR